MAEPERTVSSEAVFRGRRFAVRVVQVELSDGTRSTREIVDHPHAVCIVPVDDRGNVVLVRQYRKAPEETLTEVPAGVIEDGESPLECARRELREETGFDAAEITHLGDFWTTPGFSTELMSAFVAKGLSDDSLPADEDERIDVVRVPVSEALERARTGAYRDAKTIAALFMAERHLTPAPLHNVERGVFGETA